MSRKLPESCGADDILEKRKTPRYISRRGAKRKNTAENIPEKDTIAIIKDKEEKPTKPKQEPSDAVGKALLYKNIPGGGFSCRICSKKFSHLQRVKAHIKIKHVLSKQFTCDECGKSFKTVYQYRQHSVQHLENCSELICDKCDYRAKSKYYLKTHITRKHSEDYNFVCDHCGRRFKVKTDLKFHLGTHSAAQHMCDICGRMYSSPESLYKHRRVAHLNEYKFRCEVCHQKLLTRENLSAHMSKSHQFSCDQCDLMFNRKYYLTKHKKRIHAKIEKTNLCSICGKAFVCSATMRVHYLTHAKIKPYVCNVCGHSFTQRSSMMLHWKKKHPEQTVPPPPVILTNFFDTLKLQQQIT